MLGAVKIAVSQSENPGRQWPGVPRDQVDRFAERQSVQELVGETLDLRPELGEPFRAEELTDQASQPAMVVAILVEHAAAQRPGQLRFSFRPHQVLLDDRMAMLHQIPLQGRVGQDHPGLVIPSDHPHPEATVFHRCGRSRLLESVQRRIGIMHEFPCEQPEHRSRGGIIHRIDLPESMRTHKRHSDFQFR
jgi:hypothetical protein